MTVLSLFVPVDSKGNLELVKGDRTERALELFSPLDANGWLQVTAGYYDAGFFDNEPPVITLRGDNPLRVLVGDAFTDPGATARDNKDWIRPESIVVSGSVDAFTLGTYTLVYTVADAAGNVSEPVLRTVIVEPEAPPLQPVPAVPKRSQLATLTALSDHNERNIDLLIVDDDIDIDDLNIPLGIFGRNSIAQDIKHMIRESGFLVTLVGERDRQRITHVLIQLTLIIEADYRLIPGTVKFSQVDGAGTWWLTASTYEYGLIEMAL